MKVSIQKCYEIAQEQRDLGNLEYLSLKSAWIIECACKMVAWDGRWTLSEYAKAEGITQSDVETMALKIYESGFEPWQVEAFAFTASLISPPRTKWVIE